MEAHFLPLLICALFIGAPFLGKERPLPAGVTWLPVEPKCLLQEERVHDLSSCIITHLSPDPVHQYMIPRAGDACGAL